MKFNIVRTSNYNLKEEREISSLEELLAFQNEVDSPLILTPPWSVVKMDGGLIERGWELEIYDDYRE